MEDKGLTERKEGRYEPKFTFYDQGYSAVESGLRSMNSTAKLLFFFGASPGLSVSWWLISSGRTRGRP